MSEMIASPSIESLRQVVTGTKMRCELDKAPLPVHANTFWNSVRSSDSATIQDG